MMDFGWRKKVEKLRMVILSGGHQLARELAPGFSRILESFARAAKSGDGSGLQEEFANIPQDDHKQQLWEPLEVHGWLIQSTMYLRDGQLWWLVHAVRKNERAPIPSDNDVKFLDKVLEQLGAVPVRHAIIGPRSSPAGEPALPFGWWTWRNVWPLYEIQVNKDKRGDPDKIRIVPLGTRETDGYTSLRAQDFAVVDDQEER
jgi:hypothetical protein